MTADLKLTAVALHASECLEVEMDYPYTNRATGAYRYRAYLDGREAICPCSGRLYYDPDNHRLECDFNDCRRTFPVTDN